MTNWTIRRLITSFILSMNFARRRTTATVPSKISQMELAAYDTVAYDFYNETSNSGSLKRF